jgi:hypothetical protein
MRFAVWVVLFLSLSPMGAELGSPTAQAQDGPAVRAAEQNTEQTSHGPKDEKKPLTNDDVISMVKAGLPANTIVLAIQHSATLFDTSPPALISLHTEGVPRTVLDAMLTAGSQNPTPPAAPPVPTPAAPTTAKVKASTPDLHTIRKIYLETAWADDEAITARRVMAIQKHTCLQVVETAGAADATLTWSGLGLTGGALELRTNDGLVLWSKVGSFTTPLKAMSLALGCPK